MVESPGVDFALAAYHEGGQWQVQALTDQVLVDVATLAAGLRRFPADGGALAMIGFDEDVFLILRTTGSQVRALLSDITVADEWDLARTVIEYLGLPFPEDEDDAAPAGDLDLLGDLGLHAADLGELVDDEEGFSDELLSEVANRLGFGSAFDAAVGLTSA